MIRYRVAERKLLAAISDRWHVRASERTRAFIAANTYFEPPSPFWTEVKSVFRAVQRDKCAYCERRLAAGSAGSIEYDLEHFRPKGRVDEWPKPDATARFSYVTKGGFDVGYFGLAYHPLNYLVSCKVCNSTYKKNYFPIEGFYGPADARHPQALANELSLLIYPIGSHDDDPANLIEFDGVLAIAKHQRGRRHRRASVVIELFELNTREELLRERSQQIVFFFQELERQRRGWRSHADKIIKAARRAAFPHSNCMLSFARLYVRDLSRARGFADRGREYLASQGLA